MSEPKATRVHPDPVRRECDREAARGLIERGAGNRIGQQVGMRPARRDGGDVDDGAHGPVLGLVLLGLRDHAVRHRLAEPEGREHVLVEQGLHRTVGGVERIGRQDLAAGVHQDVDPVEGIERGRQQVRHRQLLAQVAREVADLPLVVLDHSAFVGQPFLVPVGEHHVRAPIDEMPRDGEADAVGGPGDDRGLALDRECHRLCPLDGRPGPCRGLPAS
jgi:hypothetical protein